MLRGGSWNTDQPNVRAANRDNDTPTNRNDNIGFRCVVPPGVFLESQVHQVYERGVSAQGEHARSVPGWVAHSTKDKVALLCVVGCGSTLRAGPNFLLAGSGWQADKRMDVSDYPFSSVAASNDGFMGIKRGFYNR